jgi:hypothetical protein
VSGWAEIRALLILSYGECFRGGCVGIVGSIRLPALPILQPFVLTLLEHLFAVI